MTTTSGLIQELAERGVVERVDRQSLVVLSPIFLVEKDPGKFRFILNLKKLNACLTYHKFKMESLPVALQLISKGCWMAKLDLSDAYYAVKVHERYRSYLGFHWKGSFYRFLRMPNGLSPAPRRFTKILKPVVAKLRSLGMKACIYLDDIFLAAATHDQQMSHLTAARDLLESLGFVINEKKSSQVPTQEVTFLGFVLNSVDMTISLPEAKRLGLRTTCQKLLQKELVSVRQLACIVGSIHAADPAIRVARLHYRHLQRLQIVHGRTKLGFKQRLVLTKEARAELKWWVDYLERDQPVALEPDQQEPIEIFTDASLTGWGGFCRGEGVQGVWSPAARKCHINLLELRAVHNVFRHFFANSANIKVLLNIDNMVALHYIRKMGGTRSERLNQAALEFWDWILERNISLRLQYIPSKAPRRTQRPI